ncbi:uncharacterized protein F4822DRAFT_433891 [Hypoxylon trugodes]|uniref:uncharacterized protein n=1 Tax=Hypoxylon trugodes TaxID=326681 RepID=UPI00219FFC9B|nr:uncharacterized protein F4822DRAFT_433891 [Hypoxylon trugodes]KAI1383941.1 hypothetical protein F4822DRAFT_433891 [Hypoxylon trugodes]
MPRPTSRTLFVVVPGASQSPSHYGYLLHLLQSRGYPTLSALLPSTGSTENVIVYNDTQYVLKRMPLPILDVEKHNVILVTHSYSSIPGSAAAMGLSKAERTAQGKTTHLPPHIGIGDGDYAGLLTCDDPAPKLVQDAIAMSTLCPSFASFHSPCPKASWSSEHYKGRIAYIRAVKDVGIPLEGQNMMLKGTGVEWIENDIDTGHSPQIVQPETLLVIFIELAEQWEKL